MLGNLVFHFICRSLSSGPPTLPETMLEGSYGMSFLSYNHKTLGNSVYSSICSINNLEVLYISENIFLMAALFTIFM